MGKKSSAATTTTTSQQQDNRVIAGDQGIALGNASSYLQTDSSTSIA